MRLMDSKRDVVVPKGTTAIYDASLGPLKIDGRLVNHGTIRMWSSQKDVSESAIIASELESDGAIISDLPKLTIAAANIDAHGGKISASDRIVLNSKNDLQVRGGTFDSQWVDFITPGKLQVRADRIRGQVSIEADSIAFGVTSGNLTVASSKVSGDPLYYNSGGDVSIPTTSTGGEDLYLFATGNVTVTGPVDTSGGPNDSNHLGRFFAIAGLPSVGPPPPIDQQTMVVCQNCDSEMAMLGVTSFAGTGTVNVMGGITSKGVAHLGGGVITVGGNVVTSASGGFAISFLNSATVNGTITAGSGGVSFVTTDFTVYSQNQTVTVTGQIVSPGSINIITAGSGSIQLGDVNAGLGGAINISAGSPMVPTCETPSPQKVSVGLATITTGHLTASYFITLAASGNISTGAVDLVQNGSPLPGPGSHYMQINANVANTGAPVFQVGAGGTNGTGIITNHGRHNPFGDALVITNPGGISVTTADIKEMHNIGLDATSGLITLNAGLSVNGTSVFRAGSIVMQGSKLIVPATASLTANDTTVGSTDPAPTIMLAFSEIPLSGNLHVTTNSDQGTSVKIYTAGNLIIDISEICTVNPPVSGPVLFSGSGKAEITANSKTGSVQIIGTPLTFAAGTIGVTSKGDNTNSIQINWDGVVRNNNSFVSTGGKVTLDADSAAGNATASAGMISIQADGINVTSPFDAHANAIATSSGKGGTIGITAASGTLTAGTSNFALNADSLGSGNGGTLNLTAPSMTLNGANLKVTAGPTGNGTGGTISGTTTTGDLTITSGTLSANGAGSGTGGNITLTGNPVNLQSGSHIFATSGATGAGGNVTVTGVGIGTVTANGSIDATGDTDGGTITISGGSYTQGVPSSGALITAKAQTNGTGGTVSITVNSGSGQMDVGAIDVSSASGTGGTISLTSNLTSGSHNMHLFGTLAANGAISGSIGIGYGQSTLGTGIQLDNSAVVSANGNGGGNGILFENTSSNDLLVTGQGGTVQATNSTLNFVAAASHNVTVNFAPTTSNKIAILSPLSASGAVVSITASSLSGDLLTLANVSATTSLTIMLESDLGIAGGNSGSISTPSLNIVGISGNTGSNTAPFMITSVGTLDVETTGTGGTGSVFITNNDATGQGLTLNKSAVNTDIIGGAYQISSNGNITVNNGGITTNNGAMSIKSTNGSVTVNGALNSSLDSIDLEATSGLTLQAQLNSGTAASIIENGSNNISFNNVGVFQAGVSTNAGNLTIEITGASGDIFFADAGYSSTGGSLLVSTGGTPEESCNALHCAPSGPGTVQYGSSDLTKIFWDNPLGIFFFSGTIAVTQANSQIIAFDSHSTTVSRITAVGGTTFTAH